jgi:trk system potassium uptake protein TrkH
MTASTTVGFNTIPIGAVSSGSLFLLTVAMVIGASPSGTGGGLKTTTFTALWAEMIAVFRRRDVTTFLGKVIPEVRMRSAVAGAVFYVLTLAAGLYALTLVESAPLDDQLFECASALGTVGLSRGITGSLTAAGKIILIALMFVGRLGPVVLGMAFFRSTAPASTTERLEEDVAL